MTSKTKLIRTIYLYLAAGVSLIFVAIGTGTLLNTGLKAALFPEAEKRSYQQCNNQPPFAGPTEVKTVSGVATPDQKNQLDQMLQDYQNWKDTNTGDKCIKAERQNNLVDALTMMIIALPILLIHWNIIKKEKEEKEEA